jgi:hypothetical protein
VTVCTPEDGIVKDEICRNSDDVRLISRTFLVIDCIVIINNAVDYNGAKFGIKTLKLLYIALFNILNYVYHESQVSLLCCLTVQMWTYAVTQCSGKYKE